MLYIGEKVGSRPGRRPADRHRARPAGRHHHHRQGRPQCARGAGHRRAGLPAQRARRLHGQDRDRAGLSRRHDRPRQVADRECPRARRGQGRRAERDHRLRARPPAPRRDHRRAARARLRHQADPRRRRRRGHRHHRSRHRRSTSTWASGGAPEGVLAAAALRCVGGQIQGRLLFRNDDERARARRWGIEDLDRIYTLEDMAKGDCIFAATGVTDGSLLDGRQAPQGRLHRRPKASSCAPAPAPSAGSATEHHKGVA